MTTSPVNFLLFGASGAIGTAIANQALNRSWIVTATARSLPTAKDERLRWVQLDPLRDPSSADGLVASAPYSAVCWAQGSNMSDSVYNVDISAHMELYNANCSYILATLQFLLAKHLLQHGARLCIISSIWQDIARQTKLSYCMTKAALHGLVLSASADLAADGHLINAVLPGALETPMTRKNLKPEEMERIERATGFNRLASPEDVASIVCFLCSTENTGITGQFIAADLGFSRVRFV